MSSGPISPPLPVNATISIQPLPTAIPSGVASDVPSVLAALAGGSTLQGFVINRDGQNNPVLRTNLGDVLVRSDVFIKTGSDVVIRVDATQPGRARIVSIDGLPPEDYVSQNARVNAEDSITNTALPTRTANATAATPANPAAPTLEALVLKTAPALPLLPGETIAPRLQGLKPGQPLRVQILNAQLPAPAVSLSSITEPASLLEQLLPPPSTAPQTAPQSAASNPTPAAPRPGAALAAETLPTPQAETATPKPLAAEASVTVRAAPAAQAPLPPPQTAPASELTLENTPVPPTPFPLASQLPQVSVTATTPAFASPLFAQEITQPTSRSAAAPGIASPPAAATSAVSASPLISAESPTSAPFVPPADALRAVVIGHEADGAAILHTPVATLKLYTAQPVPQGTTLILSATPGNAPTLTPLPTEPTASEQLRPVARDLQDAVSTILQLPLIAAAADIAAFVPTANAHLASTLLFFLAAVKGSDPAALFSARGVEKLRAFAPELLTRLRGDLEQLQPLLSPPPGTPWASVSVPVLVQGQVQLAQLYFKRDDESAGSVTKTAAAGHGQRFIVDVDLSQLGPMQFDGFVRQAAGQNKKQLDLVIRSGRALPPDVLNGIRERFTSALELTGLNGQAVFQQGSQHFVRPEAAPALLNSGNVHKPILA